MNYRPEPVTKEGLMGAFVFVLMIGAVLLMFSVWAFGAAEAQGSIGILVTSSPDGSQESALVLRTPPYFPDVAAELVLFDHEHIVGLVLTSPMDYSVIPEGYSFAPIMGNTDLISIGRQSNPFKHGYFSGRVNAANYSASGQAGLNTLIHLPGCILTIRGGLIVGAQSTSPFNQPCP